MRSFLSSVGPAISGILLGMMIGLGLAIATLDGASKAVKPKRNSISAAANSALRRRLFEIEHMAILATFAGLGVLQGIIFMYGMIFNPRVC